MQPGKLWRHAGGVSDCVRQCAADGIRRCYRIWHDNGRNETAGGNGTDAGAIRTIPADAFVYSGGTLPAWGRRYVSGIFQCGGG